MKRLAVVLALFSAACGGSQMAGPTPVSEVPVTVATALPAGLDPAYVRALAPKRWDGGPFHHCFSADVDRAALERIAERMSALSGIPRTEAGACNVEWVVNSQGTDTKALATLYGTDTAILRARVAFATDRASREFQPAMHEAGHILGMDHSPRADDLMAPAGMIGVDYFSSRELAVLAWMYGR
jgi:hypothetical protein